MAQPSDARLEQLEARVRGLESELHALRARLDAPQVSFGPVADQPPPPAPGQIPARRPPPPPVRPSVVAPTQRAPLVLESEVVLKWGGVGLVVLAIGFAVSTAIRRGWIGPELQLAGALAVSLALIGVGWRLRPTRAPWSHALCSGGVAALYTTVASDLFLDQTSDTTAYVSIAFIGLAGYIVARLVPSEWVGAATITGGLVSWFVVAEGELPFMTSWAWITALVMIAMLLSLERTWFGLRVLTHGAGLVAVAALAGRVETGIQEGMALITAALLVASFARVPSVGDLTTVWQQLEIQLASIVGPWALVVIVIALDLWEDDTTVGTTGLAVAAAFALLALGARPWIKPAHVVSLAIAASVTLSIALAVLFSTTVAFVGLAVQGAGLVFLARALSNNLRVYVNAAIVAGISALYLAVSTVEAWSVDAPIADDVAHLGIMAALAVAGWETRQRETQQLTQAAVLAFVLTWLGSVLVHLPQGQAAVSVSWAIVGTAVLVTGATQKVPRFGAAGLGVLALTVAKLLTVDLQEVDTLWRAGLFFVVGLGIMRLGFLLPRLTGAADLRAREATSDQRDGGPDGADPKAFSEVADPRP